MSRTLTLVCSIFLLTISLVPHALATHQDDAGTGGDAPGSPADAIPVAFGTWSGRLSGDEGDKEDWYRLSLAGLAPTQGVRVTFTTNSYATLYGYDREPIYYWGYWSVFGMSADDGRPGVQHFVTGLSEIYLRVGSGSAAYTVTFETFERPDLLVEDVRVAPRNVTTDLAGSLPLGTQRDVTFDLANDGTGAPLGSTFVTVTAYHTVGSRSIAAFYAPPLAPGERATFTVPWDATGELGDARIVVRVSTSFDQDPGNNEASATSYVIVGNLGFGVDLLPP